MRTRLAVSRQHHLKSNYYRDVALKLDLVVGRLLSQAETMSGYRPPERFSGRGAAVRAAVQRTAGFVLTDWAAYRQHCLAQHAVYTERVPQQGIARLADRDVADLMHHGAQTDYVSRVGQRDLVITDEIHRKSDGDLYFKEKGTRFLHSVLQRAPDIATVLSIGGRIDSTSAYLAAAFPDRTFVSLDFQSNLQEQNEQAFGALPDNWRFLSGYALDYFQKGLPVDCVYMMATSVLFGADELDAYLAAFASSGVRNVVLSESWFPRTGSLRLGRVPRPEAIRTRRPYSAGSIGNFHHNYHRALERHGYQVRESVIRDDHRDSDYYVVQIWASR